MVETVRVCAGREKDSERVSVKVIDCDLDGVSEGVCDADRDTLGDSTDGVGEEESEAPEGVTAKDPVALSMSLVTDSEAEDERSFEGVLDVLYGVTVISNVRESEIVSDRNACVKESDTDPVVDKLEVKIEEDCCCVKLKDAEGVSLERVKLTSAVAVLSVIDPVGEGVNVGLSVGMLLESACDTENVAVSFVRLGVNEREDDLESLE